MISKGDQVIVSSSEHNTDHTALEIGKAEDLLQLRVPNLEKHQQTNRTNVPESDIVTWQGKAKESS